MIETRTDLKNKGEILEYKTEEYRMKQSEFEESNTALTEKYNEQIWRSQRNQKLLETTRIEDGPAGEWQSLRSNCS